MKRTWRNVGILLTVFAVVSLLSFLLVWSTMDSRERTADGGYVTARMLSSAAMMVVGLVIVGFARTPAKEAEPEGTLKGTLAVFFVSVGLLACANAAAAVLTLSSTMAGIALVGSAIVLIVGIYLLQREKGTSGDDPRNARA